MARELAVRLDPDTVGEDRVRDAFREALIGPWQYADKKVHSWGWDVNAQRDKATAREDPEGASSGVAGAYWLAWEALPLFPVIGGHALGAGRRSWSWPLSSRLLSLAATRSLLLCAPLLDDIERRAMGVERWQTTIAQSGRLGFFQPARVLL
jgi:hypothetical protein